MTTACTSLPDTSGYTAATIELRQSVNVVGDAVATELKIAGQPRDGDSEPIGKIRANLLVKASEFETSWKDVGVSLGAMVQYAESIEGIVRAGNEGAESAQKVAAAVKTLADTVSGDPMTEGAKAALSTVSGTVAAIYGEFSKVRASKSLEKSLDTVGPTITKITSLVDELLRQAGRTHHHAVAISRLTVTTSDRFTDWDEIVERIDAEQKGVLDDLSDPALSPTDRKAKRARSDELAVLRERALPRLAEAQAAETVLALREKKGQELIAASRTALGDWAAAHQKLAAAVHNRTPVSVASLQAATAEIRELIKQWRAL